MSVVTTADAHIRAVRDAVKNLDEALHTAIMEVCVKECWGSDQYRDSFKRNLRAMSTKLSELRDL